METMKDILSCKSIENVTAEKEYREGKLYFTIPSDGKYYIASDTKDTANSPITADTKLIIKVKTTNVQGAVNGSTQANLVTPEAGTFCCKATWAKDTAFEYSVLSDVVTVTQPIISSKYTVTVNGGT